MRHDTRAMLRAYDAQRDAPSTEAEDRAYRAPALPRNQPQPMGIRAALEWAFGVEMAQLDFDGSEAASVGTDSIWRMMQDHNLGCRVDGGGRSASHSDAEVIASFVAALPAGRGGRSMAVRIAGLARAGIAPDPMLDVRQRIVPVDMRQPNQHGPRARSEPVPLNEPGRWVFPAGRGRPPAPSHWTRVTDSPTGAQISAARRGWLDWWGALLWLGQDLRSCGRLDRVIITTEMPPMTPWQQSA